MSHVTKVPIVFLTFMEGPAILLVGSCVTRYKTSDRGDYVYPT